MKSNVGTGVAFGWEVDGLLSLDSQLLSKLCLWSSSASLKHVWQRAQANRPFFSGLRVCDGWDTTSWLGRTRLRTWLGIVESSNGLVVGRAKEFPDSSNCEESWRRSVIPFPLPGFSDTWNLVCISSTNSPILQRNHLSTRGVLHPQLHMYEWILLTTWWCQWWAWHSWC